MMRCNLRGGVWLGVLAAACTVALGAPADDLQRGVDLYKARDYARAREVLQKLDAASLSEPQRTVRSDYLAKLRDVTQPQVRQPSEPPRNPAAAAAPSGETFVRYPANWAEICRRQERFGAAQRTEDKPSREARVKFNRIVPEIRFDTGTTFSDAIERIRRDSGLNIVINWPALELAGVTREQEVALPRLTNITWRKVTELLLQQVSASLGGAALVDWAIETGILTISTRDDLNTHLSLRVYDIGDLLVPRQVVPRGNGLQMGGGTGSGVGGAAGGGGLGGGATGG